MSKRVVNASRPTDGWHKVEFRNATTNPLPSEDMYRGYVTRPESDVRTYDNYYQYSMTVNYK